MSVQDVLKKNRPHLSVSSLRTYSSILNNLAKQLGVEPSVSFFEKEHDKVLSHLHKNVRSDRRKTILAALVSLTGKGKATEDYRTQMTKDADDYDEKRDSQIMSDRDKENWVGQDHVLQTYKGLLKDAFHLFRKPHLTTAEKDRLQNLVILSLYVLIPPRRSLDYVTMKIRNFDKDKDNFFDKSSLAFNKYKTSKKYGEQTLKIPPKLASMLRRWREKQDSDYLLTGKNNGPLSQSQLTLRLNKIFGGKKVGTNLLRKMFLSDKYKDLPKLEEMRDTARSMGHSVDEALESYVKHPTKSD
jgi:hypothetical protein